MKTIKFTSKTSLILDGKEYKGYLVSELPNSFGFIYNEDKEQDGISEWFNMNGLTFIYN